MKKALVVVHPGSTCGSADFNMGGIPAAQARERLANTLHRWTDQVLVIDGELSDELEHYAMPALAINNHADHGRLERTVACGFTSDDWVEQACTFIAERVAPDTQLLLTGAWHQKGDRQGCIDAVQENLASLGFSTEISPCALVL